MNYKLLIILSIIFTTIACKHSIGNRVGGQLNICESEKYRSLFPQNTIDAIGIKIVNHVYEGLVRFDEKTLKIKSGIASHWEVNEGNTSYTFHLRKGIKFHPDKVFKEETDRELKADDVIFSFKLLSSYHDENLGFESTFKDLVIGATDHYILSVNDGIDIELEGIKKIDDYTIQINLEHPSPYFLYLLALPYCSILSKQAYIEYKAKTQIGTGPFKIKSIGQDDVKLVKNEDYYLQDSLGQKLPYLDNLNFNFNVSVEDQIKSFTNGSLDVLSKMTKEKLNHKIKELKITDKRETIDYNMPYMAVSYFGFNLQDKTLSNKKIRQAINYAIDVNQIRDMLLATKNNHPLNLRGITPTNLFEEYNTSDVNNYAQDTNKAKQLLKEAGYANGLGIDTIEIDINKGRGNNQIIANEIKRQLKEILGINMKINTMTFSQKINKSKSGNSQFFKAGWIADYPHPQNFLSLFYGRDVPSAEESYDSYPNMTRYKNDAFDELYEKAQRVPLDQTYKYLKEAEKILMEDAPILVLWYGKAPVLTSKKINNYPVNVMGYVDFTKVWLTE